MCEGDRGVGDCCVCVCARGCGCGCACICVVVVAGQEREGGTAALKGEALRVELTRRTEVTVTQVDPTKQMAWSIYSYQSASVMKSLSLIQI